ncbi:MAG: hypothetical protein RMJ98_04065 [Myxococcales bacterium]|nr:hypothetical protein [Polyangiaceae bacterium]MDW8248465.1 hypothetical protein [Myxococcales bacterium]
MKWVLLALGLLAVVAWGLPSGPLVAVLRLGLGLGLVAALVGVGLGGLLVGVAFAFGRASVRWFARGTEVLLSVPWLIFLGLLGQGWRGELRFFTAYTLIWAARSSAVLLEDVRALEVEPFLEGAQALGARRITIFLRHMGPWLVPVAIRLVVEGMAAAAPLDLLLSLAGVGSGLQDGLVQAAAPGQARGDWALACGGAAVLAAALLALAERLRATR